MNIPIGIVGDESTILIDIDCEEFEEVSDIEIMVNGAKLKLDTLGLQYFKTYKQRDGN